MKIVLAPYEKRNIGVNAAVVSFDNDDLNEHRTLKNNLFYDIDNFARENDIKYFTVKFPAEFCNINECLQKNHFIYAETQLTFLIDLKKLNFEDYKNFDNSGFHCEEIDANDSKNKKVINTILDDIGSGLFYTDRVSVDEKFGLSVSSIRYVNWFNDMINGNYHLFVTFNKDEIVGFNIDKIDGVKIGGGGW